MTNTPDAWLNWAEELYAAHPSGVTIIVLVLVLFLFAGQIAALVKNLLVVVKILLILIVVVLVAKVYRGPPASEAPPAPSPRPFEPDEPPPAPVDGPSWVDT